MAIMAQVLLLHAWYIYLYINLYSTLQGNYSEALLAQARQRGESWGVYKKNWKGPAAENEYVNTDINISIFYSPDMVAQKRISYM